MSLQALAFLLGCGLIVIAIVGGGIEAKEVKVPRLSPLSRMLSAVFGIILLVGATGASEMIGGWLSASAGGNESASSAPATDNLAAAANIAAAVQPPPSPAPAPPVKGVEPAEANVVATIITPLTPAVDQSPAPRPGNNRRTVTITDSLGPEQIYERVQIHIGGRQIALFSIDTNQPTQSLEIEVRDGDDYMLTGSEAARESDGSVRVRTVRGSGSFGSTTTRYSLSNTRSSEVATIRLNAR